MKRRTLLAALVTAGLLTLPGSAGGREQAPWFGTWELNPGKSTTRSAPSPYKRVTIRIEPSGDGLGVVYDMVGTRGGVTHMEWTGKFDGRDYAVHGVDYVLTNAYQLLGDRQYAIVVKVDGVTAATAVAVVSPDGNTMTVETTERSQGKTAVTKAVYDKR
jgi:hypothetical protein